MKTRLYRPYLGLAFISLFSACASDGALTGMEKDNQAAQVYYVTAGSLNLRACANTDCKIISILKRGDFGRIIARQEGWVELELEGKNRSGWVSGRYLSNELVAKEVQMPAKKAPPESPPVMPDEGLADPVLPPPTLNEELASPQPRVLDAPPALSESLSDDPGAPGVSPTLDAVQLFGEQNVEDGVSELDNSNDPALENYINRRRLLKNWPSK